LIEEYVYNRNKITYIIENAECTHKLRKEMVCFTRQFLSKKYESLGLTLPRRSREFGLSLP
jgi:3-methyladenine DNA glycosylase Tag